MATRNVRLAAALAGSVLVSDPAVTLAASPPSGGPATSAGNTRQLTPEQIAEGRQRAIDNIVSGDPAAARWARAACADRDIVASQAAAIAAGNPSSPDASDSCLAAITREAKDRHAFGLYRDIMFHETGSETGGEQLPARITDAILAGVSSVDLAPSKTLPITSGLALDTGFVSAWRNNGQDVPVVINDEAKLKAATEKCLSQAGNNKTCYVVGYVQGARAFAAANRTVSNDPAAQPTAVARSR